MTKNKIFLAALAVITLFFGATFATAKAKKQQKSASLKIVATIFPEYDWVREILGENSADAHITLLLDNGVDLHSYQPTVQDIAQISDCDVFVYVGGESDKTLLNIRIFDERTKKAKYQQQTDEAQKKGESNCPLCALGDTLNKNKIWKIGEMDADHVTAWSKGGSTDIKNCQMLCKTHNRAKGNR